MLIVCLNIILNHPRQIIQMIKEFNMDLNKEEIQEVVQLPDNYQVVELPNTDKKEINFFIQNKKINFSNSELKNKNGRIWYLKIKITDSLSIRYFHLFQDRPDYQNKWFLKDHNTKTYSNISEEMALIMIKELKKTIDLKIMEVIGNRLDNKKYLKINQIQNLEDILTELN